MSDGYAQRTDLTQKLPVSTAKSKTYGDATASRASQQAVPMGNPVSNVPRGTSQRPPIVPLGAPSQRPNEPITAGADFGAGPNALAAGIPYHPANVDNVLEELKAIYRAFPNDDLADLLDSAIREGY